MSRTSDITRQVTVAVSAVLAVLGAVWGSGMFGGGSMQDAAGGALTDDATTVAPDGPAFSIWSVIYAGLVAYAIWQALPRNRGSARHRRVGYLVAASMLLNAVWLAVVMADLLWLSVVVIVVLLVALGLTFHLLRRHPGGGIVESIVTDGTVGLYLGWITAATIANVAALLADSGYDGAPLGPDGWGVALTAVAGVVGVLIALAGRGRLAPGAALAWALAWVAVGRTTGDLVSIPTAVTAGIAAGVVVLVTIVVRVVATRRGTRT